MCQMYQSIPSKYQKNLHKVCYPMSLTWSQKFFSVSLACAKVVLQLNYPENTLTWADIQNSALQGIEYKIEESQKILHHHVSVDEYSQSTFLHTSELWFLGYPLVSLSAHCVCTSVNGKTLVVVSKLPAPGLCLFLSRVAILHLSTSLSI